MGNLTIALDEKLLRRARVKAVQEGTSVNALLREKLREYADAESAEPEHVTATREFLNVARRARGNSRGRRWTREELHERR